MKDIYGINDKALGDDPTFITECLRKLALMSILVYPKRMMGLK
jgi:hypothetical protein